MEKAESYSTIARCFKTSTKSEQTFHTNGHLRLTKSTGGTRVPRGMGVPPVYEDERPSV